MAVFYMHVAEIFFPDKFTTLGVQAIEAGRAKGGDNVAAVGDR